MDHATQTPSTVLLLDDDPDLLRALARVVRAAGFEVITTTSQREAIEHAILGRIGALVCDLHMPNMTGTVVLSMVARSAPQVSRVLLTGDEDFQRVSSMLVPDAVQAFVFKLDAGHRLPSLLRELAERRDLLDPSDGEIARHGRAVAVGIVRALALRDHETEAHCWRVAAMSLRMARELGMAGVARLHLELGAILHDVGKIGIPDAVLRKPGPLTSDERLEMQRHPELGARMLSEIPLLRGAAEVVLHHHERWGGGGYPRGIAGEAIPLAARVFQVADMYDSIVSDRPYRQGRSPAAAREVIAAEAGQQLDPAVVAAFERIPADEWASIWWNAATAHPPLRPTQVAEVIGWLRSAP